MSDELLDLYSKFNSYLPIKPRNTCEVEYIEQVRNHIVNSIESSSWQFAYLGFHLLLVYIQTIILKSTSYNKLKLMLTHESKAKYKTLMELSNEMYLSKLPQIDERKLFRLLRSCKVKDSDIKLLEDGLTKRNQIAHCNFSNSFSNEESLITEVSGIIDIMRKITKAIRPSLRKIYVKTYAWFDGIDEVSSEDIEMVVDENLIAGYYLSEKDLELILSSKKTDNQFEPQVLERLIHYLPEKE
jgi:hypothetical protein